MFLSGVQLSIFQCCQKLRTCTVWMHALQHQAAGVCLSAFPSLESHRYATAIGVTCTSTTVIA